MKLHVVTSVAEVHQLPRLDTYETAWALICASFALCWHISSVAPFLLSVPTRWWVLCFFCIWMNPTRKWRHPSCWHPNLIPSVLAGCLPRRVTGESRAVAVLLSPKFDMLTSSESGRTMLRNAWRRPKRFFKQRSPWVWKPSLEQNVSHFCGLLHSHSGVGFVEPCTEQLRFGIRRDHRPCDLRTEMLRLAENCKRGLVPWSKTILCWSFQVQLPTVCYWHLCSFSKFLFLLYCWADSINCGCQKMIYTLVFLCVFMCFLWMFYVFLCV